MARRGARNSNGCGCLLMLVLGLVIFVYSEIHGPDQPAVTNAGADGLTSASPTATPTMSPAPTAAASAVSGGGSSSGGRRHVYVDINPLHPLHPHIHVHF